MAEDWAKKAGKAPHSLRRSQPGPPSRLVIRGASARPRRSASRGGGSGSKGLSQSQWDTPGGLRELYPPRTVDNVHMRMFLLFSFVVVGVIAAGAQAPATPAKPQQGTSQPKPAPAPPTTQPAPKPAPGTTTPGARPEQSRRIGHHRHGSQRCDVVRDTGQRHRRDHAERRDERERQPQCDRPDGGDVPIEIRWGEVDLVRA